MTISQTRTSSSTTLVAPEPDLPPWSLLTNHAYVLLAIRRDPSARQRDIAYAVGITVGAVQKIIHELEEAGFVQTEKVGRRNRYRVVDDRPLRHPLGDSRTVKDLLSSLEQ